MTQQRPKPGRPPAGTASSTSQQIVAAACRHFAQYGLKGSSNRHIAADAGVTAAMVHYYFRSKEDLHLAVLDAAFATLLDTVASLNTLEDWARAFHAHLSAHRWLPHLMLREVLPHDGGLRTLFMRAYAPRLFGLLRARVADAAQQRQLGATFDIDRHAVLLMGMMVYPFLVGHGIAQDLTGRHFDQRMFDGFRDDALRLFMAGLDASKAPSR